MPRTVPCPHARSSHGEHKEDSLEYRTCSENERLRVLRLRGTRERLAGNPAQASPALAAGSALTPMQRLAALVNLTAPKRESDGPSFGG